MPFSHASAKATSELRIGWPRGAEGVPETVVDEHLAIAHGGEGPGRAAAGVVLAGTGLVCVAPVRCGRAAHILVAGIGIQEEPVQAGIQRGLLVVAGIADVEAGQACIPGILRAAGHALQRIGRSNLQRQIVPGLFHRDQRGGDAHVHPPLAAGIELDVAGGAAGVDAAAAAPGPVETGRDVHAAGAVGQAAARIGVAVQRLRGGIQGQPTTRIDIVEQQVGVAVFGEIEAEQRRMVGRRDRGGDAVVEAHVVTVGARTLMAALERQRTLAAVGGRHAAVGRGHHLERLAIAHPRAGLVAQRKRLQLRAVLRIVLLVPAVQPVQRTGIGHRGPEVESVRHCRGREIVAAREGAVGLGAAGGQHPVGDPLWPGMWLCVQAHVIDPAGHRCTFGTGHLQFDRHHATPLQCGYLAQAYRLARPLLRIQRLRRALRARADGHAMLVACSAGRHAAAIVQQQVQRDIGRGHGVLADDFRQHQP
ncbi:hypothetical protein G6F68_009974 [Rhizopus microsporus]|nr:hypothetical protein G6F68_009974 [Rhizopus microsporus]